jgi:hypothetical protein
MDVNITSPITANIALIQPFWIPILNFLVGLMGALIGAGAIYFVARYEKNQEIKKVHREERKNAYLKLITLFSVAEWVHKNAKDKNTTIGIPTKEVMLTLNEFRLLASADLNYIFYKSKVDGVSEESNKAFMDEAIPAMARELQDEDVYAVLNEKLKADSQIKH